MLYPQQTLKHFIYLNTILLVSTLCDRGSRDPQTQPSVLPRRASSANGAVHRPPPTPAFAHPGTRPTCNSFKELPAMFVRLFVCSDLFSCVICLEMCLCLSGLSSKRYVYKDGGPLVLSWSFFMFINLAFRVSKIVLRQYPILYHKLAGIDLLTCFSVCRLDYHPHTARRSSIIYQQFKDFPRRSHKIQHSHFKDRLHTCHISLSAKILNMVKVEDRSPSVDTTQSKL